MAVFIRHDTHAVQKSDLEGPFFRQHGYTEAPLVVQCYVTLQCDLTCPHCIVGNDRFAAAEMPLALFDKFCQEAAALGVPEILLTGGEPLRRRDWADLIACLQSHHLAWSLNTATCPDVHQQEAIGRYPPGFVAVSLDGPAQVHNSFRGSPDAFAKAGDALRFFAAFPETVVCAGTTVSRVNLPFLEETFALVQQSSAHRWGLHLLIPEGRAESRQDLFLSTRQLRRLLKFVAQKRRHFPVSICDEIGHTGEWESLVREEAFFCAAGRAMCAVLPDGSVMPCSTLDPRHCEGNMVREDLAGIWRNGFVALRQPRREGRCAACKDWALCESGCWLQRQHGTQCFKSLWQIPRSLKIAAGMALCLGVCEEPANAAEQTAAGSDVPLPAHASMPVTNAPVNTQAVMKLTGIYASKSGGGKRPWMTAEGEKGVLRSLRWFKREQKPDGSWDSQPAAITGLALLCYLAHGERPSSPEFGNTVDRAIKWLLANQDPNGRFGESERNECAHPIATYALSEAYSITKIPAIKPVAEKALAALITGQNASGGWSSRGGATNRDDLVYMGWSVQALKAASLTDLATDDVKRAMLKALEGFRKCALPDRQQEGDLSGRADLAGAWVLGMQSLGAGDDPDVRKQLEGLRPASSQWTNVWTDGATMPAHVLYFATLANFHAGRDNFMAWNRQLVPVLMKRQRMVKNGIADEENRLRDIGWWESPGTNGSQVARVSVDTLYNTSLYCLCLEIYYRYLSMYQPPKPAPEPAEIRVIVK